MSEADLVEALRRAIGPRYPARLVERFAFTVLGRGAPSPLPPPRAQRRAHRRALAATIDQLDRLLAESWMRPYGGLGADACTSPLSFMADFLRQLRTLRIAVAAEVDELDQTGSAGRPSGGAAFPLAWLAVASWREVFKRYPGASAEGPMARALAVLGAYHGVGIPADVRPLLGRAIEAHRGMKIRVTAGE